MSCKIWQHKHTGCVECWNDRHKELAEAVEACRKDIVLKLHNKASTLTHLHEILFTGYLANWIEGGCK